MTSAEADAIWREHSDRAWAHFRTNPVYRVAKVPPAKFSLRARPVPVRLPPQEVIEIVHEVEDFPFTDRQVWRVKVGPWIVAEGFRPQANLLKELLIR